MAQVPGGACPHVAPRLDGASMQPCDACRPRESRGPQIHFKYGKEDWHGDTVGQRVEEHVRANREQGRELGRDYEPVGSRWV